jgi:hypothetical protein
MSMRNWIGAITAALAVWLMYSALSHRRRILAGRPASTIAAGPDGAPLHRLSLAMFGDIVRPMIILALAYFALKVIAAYVLLGGARFLSPFDLAGVLFLVAAYGAWLILATGGMRSARRVAGAEHRGDAATTQGARPQVAAHAPGERKRVLEPQT